MCNIEWAGDNLENIVRFLRLSKNSKQKQEHLGGLLNHRFEIANLIKKCLGEDFFKEFEKRLPSLSSDDWIRSLG